jgi:transcriptional regulator with XRE-family HTH domain
LSELQRIRKERELSQEFVARRARVAQTTYSGYERGERPVPEKVAARLSRILHVPVHAIFYVDSE